MLIITPMCCQ